MGTMHTLSNKKYPICNLTEITKKGKYVRFQTVLFAHCYTNNKKVNKYRFSQTIQAFIDTNLETSKSSTNATNNTGH